MPAFRPPCHAADRNHAADRSQPRFDGLRSMENFSTRYFVTSFLLDPDENWQTPAWPLRRVQASRIRSRFGHQLRIVVYSTWNRPSLPGILLISHTLPSFRYSDSGSSELWRRILRFSLHAWRTNGLWQSRRVFGLSRFKGKNKTVDHYCFALLVFRWQQEPR